jgi:hypothetical protein
MVEMNFDDLTLTEIPVTYRGRRYVLTEASGDAVCRWRNALLRATKLGPDGKPVAIEGLADAEPLLVSRCLYVPDKDGRLRLTPHGFPDPNYLVPLEDVRGWEGRVVGALFEKVKEISHLDMLETKEGLEEQMVKLKDRLAEMGNGEGKLKNSLKPTTAGSG